MRDYLREWRLQDWKFLWQWRFKFWSSGLWHCVLMYDTLFLRAMLPPCFRISMFWRTVLPPCGRIPMFWRAMLPPCDRTPMFWSAMLPSSSGWRWRQHGPLKYQYPITSVHGAIVQKTMTNEDYCWRQDSYKTDVCSKYKIVCIVNLSNDISHNKPTYETLLDITILSPFTVLDGVVTIS
jgi:hypothetical protein